MPNLKKDSYIATIKLKSMSKEKKKLKKEGAVRSDEIKERHSKAIEVAKRTSPDLSKLQKVRIDNSTYIYVGLDKDPKVARERFVEKMNTRVNAIRYKNYDTKDSY